MVEDQFLKVWSVTYIGLFDVKRLLALVSTEEKAKEFVEELIKEAMAKCPNSKDAFLRECLCISSVFTDLHLERI